MSEPRVPLVQERVRIDKRLVDKAVVEIRATTKEHLRAISETLKQEQVEVLRVPMDVLVETAPEVREENGTIIVPVVEERLVITKQLVLVEELHVKRTSIDKVTDIPVSLRSTEVTVSRRPSGSEHQSTPSESGEET